MSNKIKNLIILATLPFLLTGCNMQTSSSAESFDYERDRAQFITTHGTTQYGQQRLVLIEIVQTKQCFLYVHEYESTAITQAECPKEK